MSESQAVAVPHVFTAIRAVAGKISEKGILKEQYNTQQKFNFRSIDQVLNEFSGPLFDNNLLIIPKEVEQISFGTRPGTQSGTVTSVLLKVVYEFLSTLDGSTTVAVSFGEASDYADKATGKALSMAYKSLMFVMFCVPTMPEADADADHGAPETARESIRQPEAVNQPDPKAAKPAPKPTPKPASTAPVDAEEPKVSKGLGSMIADAVAEKGEAGAKLLSETAKQLGVKKITDLPKSSGAALLKSLQDL